MLTGLTQVRRIQIRDIIGRSFCGDRAVINPGSNDAFLGGRQCRAALGHLIGCQFLPKADSDSAAAMRIAGPDFPPRKISRVVVKRRPCSGSAPAWHLTHRAFRMGSTCSSNVTFGFSALGDFSSARATLTSRQMRLHKIRRQREIVASLRSTPSISALQRIPRRRYTLIAKRRSTSHINSRLRVGPTIQPREIGAAYASASAKAFTEARTGRDILPAQGQARFASAALGQIELNSLKPC